ncbi:MAG TPA: NADPH dehydrogenase NamA [Acholeplasmataceae bacterium]|jgi:NADPH2 dehydrogenase|nr:NADPH dehydrogenase NamA [Acholeplasmataceae bacterium]
MKLLFSEFKLKNLHLKNRIVMAPMCMYSAAEDSLFTPWHYVHYLTRSLGGVGAIILEATAVVAEGRITEGDLGFYQDEQIERFRNLVAAAHENQTAVGIQLAHAGRKSRTKGKIFAPSPLPYPGMNTPEKLTLEGIKAIIKAFGRAAKRAEQAGFDFIEIHAAHGYLINQFLSPLTNKRTDEYGRERSLFLKEVIEEVRKYWPKEKALWVRVSAEEYDPLGNHPQDIVRILKELSGIDLIDVSSGGVTDFKVNSYPAYQIPYSETIKKLANLPTAAGGLITDAKQAETVLKEGKADLIYFGRELLRNPYFPLHAAKALGTEIIWPKQYIRAK